MTPGPAVLVVYTLAALYGHLLVSGTGSSHSLGISPHMFFVLNNQVLDWNAAYKTCTTQDATLAFPRTLHEGEMLKDFLADASGNVTQYKDIHLGFHSLFVPREYLTVQGDAMGEIGFWQWDPESQNRTEQRCGALTVNGLKTIECSARLESVCMFKESRVHFDKIDGFGFYHFHDLNLNWTDAVSVCKTENANLLVLRSTQEYDAIFDFYTDAGLVNGSVDLMYGAHQLFADSWFLTLADDLLEESGYDMWAPGEPSDVAGADYPFVGLHLTDSNSPEEDSGLFVLPSGSPMWFICQRDLH